MIEKEIILNKETREIVNKETLKLGIDGENLQENIIFKFEDEFVDGQARIEIELQDETKTYIVIQKHNETYELPIKSVITKHGLNYMQLVITQGIDDEEIPIFKSEKFSFLIKDSINAVGEAPEGYEQWIDVANTKLNQMDNIDIEATKENHVTTITITKKDGTEETTEILDGEDGQDGIGLEYNWLGTSLGIKRENEVNYDYVDLKGDKGEPGAIKMVIVNQLPSTGAEDTIYLVPLATPESQENNYAEYIYINGQWELLGKIGIQVDLTDYALKSEIPTQLSQLTDDSTHRLVSDTEKTTWGGKYDKPSGGIPKTDLASDVQTSLGKADTALQEHQSLADYVRKTDYAGESNAGVIVTKSTYGVGTNSSGSIVPTYYTYQEYQNKGNYIFVSKGTLENVLNARIGDIASVLNAINGEVI